MEIAVGNKWRTFSSTIAYGDREVDVNEEFLYFLVKWSTSYNDFIGSASKSLTYLFTDMLFDFLRNHGHLPKQFDSVVLYLGEYSLAYDFLDDEWHRHYQVWSYFLKSLCNNGR